MPGTGATPVSITAMPTPAPVRLAVVVVFAPMIVRTSVRFVAVPVDELLIHVPVHCADRAWVVAPAATGTVAATNGRLTAAAAAASRRGTLRCRFIGCLRPW